MSFEKYCHSIGMEETRVVKGDMVSMCTFKELWDHQQQKIDRLQEIIISGYSDKGFWGRAASRLQTQNITLQEENKRLWKELESEFDKALKNFCEKRLLYSTAPLFDELKNNLGFTNE